MNKLMKVLSDKNILLILDLLNGVDHVEDLHINGVNLQLFFMYHFHQRTLKTRRFSKYRPINME